MRGRFLASEARRAWELGESPVPDSKIAELLQVSTNAITGERSGAARLPMGLAIRRDGTDNMSLLFRELGPRKERSKAGLEARAAGLWLLRG